MKKLAICFLSSIFILNLNPLITNSKIDIPNQVENEVDNKEGLGYKTLDEMLKELKEERKLIEERKLQEIEAKKLEKNKKEEDSKIKDTEIKKNEKDIKKENIKDENISKEECLPKLTVRLRGKHSKKYLCSYDFNITNENGEVENLKRDVITNYEELLKNPSLKVRVGESINFEFSEEEKKMNIYLANENSKKLKTIRNTIKVPDIDGKIVVIIDGIYKCGTIKYAVVLDIRK